jgi:hypothetical protein
MSEYRATLLPLYMGDKAVIDAYTDTIAEVLL